MYGIFTYIWLIYMVNVGKYTIHGFYGTWNSVKNSLHTENIPYMDHYTNPNNALLQRKTLKITTYVCIVWSLQNGQFKDVNSGCFSLWKVLRVQLQSLHRCGQEPDFNFPNRIWTCIHCKPHANPRFLHFCWGLWVMTQIFSAYFIFSMGFWRPKGVEL